MKYQYLDQWGKETCMENKKLYKYEKFCEGREAKEGRHLILFSKNKCPQQIKDINIIKVHTGPD